MHILIIDHLISRRNRLRSLLEKAGYTRLMFADSVDHAVEKTTDPFQYAGADDIGLIILAPNRGEKPNDITCNELKHYDDLKYIPILILTETSEYHTLKALFEAGATHCSRLPIQEKQFLSQIRSALAFERNGLPEMPAVRWSLEILSDLKELSKVGDFIQTFCDHGIKGTLHNKHIWQLKLSIHETGANIIKHAYNGLSDQPILIEAEFFNNRIIIHLSHWGRFFKPLKTDTTHWQQTGQIQEGHFGLQIIKTYVDQIRYAKDDWGKKIISLMKITGPAGL